MRWLLGLTGWLALNLAAGSMDVRADETRILKGHGGPVKSIVISADGTRALTGSFDYSFAAWDLSKSPPQLQQRFDEHDAAVNAAQFIPGLNQYISAGDDGIVRIWSAQNGELVATLKGHNHKILRLAVSANEKWAVTAAWDRTARLWNLTTASPGPVLQPHHNSVNGVAFSKDSKTVFTADYNGIIRRWRTSDGALLGQIYNHGWGINTLAALPNGREILFGALDGSVAVVDIETGQVSHQLENHERPVLSMFVSARHNLAATGGGGGVIRVWDITSWKQKFHHQHPYGPVWAMALSGAGDGIYFGGLDDFAAFWQMQPDKPFAVAKSELPRRFQISPEDDPGALQFARKCSICHTLDPDGANRAGPSLHGIFGRQVGTLAGYAYSPALKELKFTWNEHTIDQLFAQGPEKFVPGTKMPLQKMEDPQARKHLIEFLKRETGAE